MGNKIVSVCDSTLVEYLLLTAWFNENIEQRI